jgi:hypothetical protein
MLRQGYGLLFALIMLLLSVGCASVKVKNVETERRLIEANAALATLQDKIEQLYSDIESVRLDLRAFHEQPGWQEMREIIETISPPEGSEDNDAELQTLAETAAAEWTSAWQEPWEDRFRQYLNLVRRCTALEARRIGLQAELFGVQGMFLGVSASEYSKGRYDQGKASDEVVELLSRSADELGSYSINSVGLYDFQ